MNFTGAPDQVFLFPIYFCYVIGHNKAISISLFFRLFHAARRLYGFVLKASGYELISSMSLDGRKNIKSVKPAWSISHSEFKATVLHLYRRKNQGFKMNTNTFLVITRHLHCSANNSYWNKILLISTF